MTTRKQVLLTTVAASLILGSGIATAQDRSTNDTMRPRSAEAAKSQKSKQHRATNQNADNTTGQAPSSDNGPRSNAAPNKSDTSASGTTDANRGTSQKGTNNRADRNDSTAAEKTQNPNTQSSESTDRKQPSAAQSDQTKPSTDRQPSNAASSREPAAQQSNTDRSAAGPSQGAASSRNGATNSARTQSSTRLSASLQTTDKTKLDHVIAKVDVKPVASANFSVSVGTAVPDAITLHPVPADVVAIIPQYRGYDFFMVKDEFVIVEPGTHKIVDVIERRGANAEATTATRKKVQLSQKDRSYIRKHITTEHHTTTTGAASRTERRITIGEDVPESVEIDTFPENVYREVPAVRSYRYIHSGNDVYLVEPGSRRVIESIGDDD